MSQTREERGLEIAKSTHITENGDGSFSVPSQTDQGRTYTVKVIENDWTCDCPDFQNRAAEIDACKHIHATRFWIAARVELRNEPKPQVFAEDALQCGRCGSIRIIKYGMNGAKQAYWCKDCAHKFTPSLLKKAKYTPEMITLTLDLYFSGMSLRKIARTMNDHFGTSLTPVTVFRWMKRFVPQISEYANSLTPQLSDTWHADELFVKMKGAPSYKDRGSIAFLWNVMDRKTRFLLASKLTKARESKAGEWAMREAVRNAHGSEPEKILTDGLLAYKDAIGYAFQGEKRPVHIAKAGLRKPHANNNRIERLNGTLRERVKVQRGWKSMDTPIADGQRIQYNFVKPHQALQGQTPAQMAGIGVRGNKWLALLRAAVINEKSGNPN
jgi:transposase-like protein